jgi:hypothetical protein
VVCSGPSAPARTVSHEYSVCVWIPDLIYYRTGRVRCATSLRCTKCCCADVSFVLLRLPVSLLYMNYEQAFAGEGS